MVGHTVTVPFDGPASVVNMMLSLAVVDNLLNADVMETVTV
jgi:hypothetical protein